MLWRKIQLKEKNGGCWAGGYDYIIYRVVPDGLMGKGPLPTDAGSDGAGHVAIWQRTLPAQGTTNVKALAMVFLGLSKESHGAREAGQK